MQTIHARSNTWLKTSAADSSGLTRLSLGDVLSKGKRLGVNYALTFPAGSVLPVISTDGARSGKHTLVKVALNAPGTMPAFKAVQALDRSAFYVFSEHLKVLGNPEGNQPQVQRVSAASTASLASLEKPAQPSPLDYPFKLRGFKSVFLMSKNIVPGGRLNWAEATHFDPRTRRFRPPQSTQEVNRIVTMAKLWHQWARPYLAAKYNVSVTDVSIRINSWYRDPNTNRAVGGARYSRHLAGDAVDFVVFVQGKQVPPSTINKLLHSVWPGGLASSSCFTHLDLRGDVQYDSAKQKLIGGQYARWSYGF